jgi:hypothetical protein
MLTERDQSKLVFSVAAIIFLVRLLAPGWRGGFPVQFPDSVRFLNAASLGPFARDFWINERPSGVSFVLWVLQSHVMTFIVFQSLVYTASVVFLCHTILRTFTSRRLAWTVNSLIALLYIQPRFSMWNVEVLSESLSISAATLAITFSLRLLHHPQTRDVCFLSASVVALLLLRDANIIPSFFVAVGLVVAAAWHKNPPIQRALLSGAAAIVFTLAYVTFAQTESARYQFGVMNNVGLRILPTDELRKSFTSDGLPINDALLARTGKNAWEDGEAFLSQPELSDFRQWVHSDGRTDVLLSYVTEAPQWYKIWVKDASSSLAYDMNAYDRFGVLKYLPHSVFGRSGPISTGQLWIMSALAVLLCATLMKQRQQRPLGVLLISMLGIATASFAFSVLADAIEVQRHSVGPINMTFLSFILIFGYALDATSTTKKS